MSGDSNTSVYIGNLKPSARILELKQDLFDLIYKTLKINITENDISIINGRKRYAVIEVHNHQNVDFLLENLMIKTDRQNLKFNFLKLVDEGVSLHCDTVKSQDEDQAKADFENTKNKKSFANRRSLLDITRPDFGRAVAVKSKSSKSFTTGPRTSSRISNNTTRGEIKIPSRSTDLDVTIEVDDIEDTVINAVGEVNKHQPQKESVLKSSGTGVPAQLVDLRKEDVCKSMNTQVHMIPLAGSSIKEDPCKDDEFQEEAPTPLPYSTTDLETGGDDSPELYEEIDLRHISRESLRGKLTPRIHCRKSEKDSRDVHSATRRDFFEFLDRQIGVEIQDVGRRTHSDEEGSIHDQGTPYYKAGEMIYNHDLSKEFKAYFEGTFTLKKFHDYVARCICGFLNSGRKGLLLIGVHNDASLKVIEIRVLPPENLDMLYECKDGVFIRRNGILMGPIRANHIQEWVKQKHFSDINTLKMSEENMKGELNQKDLIIRRQADTIMAQKSEIEKQRDLLQKARSCVIL